MQTQIPGLEERARQYSRQQYKSLEQWKSQTQTLDKLESMSLKLNDLILNNDRKGVRQMLEAYLPLDTDGARRSLILGKFGWMRLKIPIGAKRRSLIAVWIMKRIKFKEKKLLLEKCMDLCLRSSLKIRAITLVDFDRLTTNREKNGDSLSQSEKYKSVRITDTMMNHAEEPRSSNFLSFTPSVEEAANFIGRDP